MPIFFIDHNHVEDRSGDKFCSWCSTPDGYARGVSVVTQPNFLSTPICLNCSLCEDHPLLKLVFWPEEWTELGQTWLEESQDGYRCSRCCDILCSVDYMKRDQVYIPCESSEHFWLLYAAAEHYYLYEELGPVLRDWFSDMTRIIFDYACFEDRVNRVHKYQGHTILECGSLSPQKKNPYYRLYTGSAQWTAHVRSTYSTNHVSFATDYLMFAWRDPYAQKKTQDFLQDLYKDMDQDLSFGIQPLVYSPIYLR